MFSYLQKIGKALMVPVAVLPAAAIMLGIGYWIDPSGWGANSQLAAFLIKAGAAIIDNMAILFAVGVAYGLSKDKDGAAALAGLVAFEIVTTLLSTGAVSQIMGIPQEEVHAAFGKINNQFIGILCGVISGELYNRFYKIELPKFLAFFSGKRFVPIITSVVMIVVSFILTYIWPIIYGALVTFGTSIAKLGPVGAGIYGFFNRLLIPVGLHHAVNSVFWFNVAGINDIGRFWGSPDMAYADLPEILQGTYHVGMYQAGFFPIMMFGLLGACAAFIQTSKPENRTKIFSIMVAAGFTSFLTGVTEPIEFAFMFVAPKNPNANNPFMLVVLGLIFFVIYYFVFLFVIKAFNLKTPGREESEEEKAEAIKIKTTNSELAESLVGLLGGADNIVEVDNCTTRLRLKVKDSANIKEAEIKKLVPGVLKPSKETVQVIIGPHVEFVATELKRVLGK